MASEGAQRENQFASVLDVTLSKGGYVMAMVQAYFDESGTSDGERFLCVAGYIFTKENAVALGEEWAVMLEKYDDLPYFHMNECNQHSGIYEALGEQRCIEAAAEAIALTKKYASRGIAVSIDREAYDLLPPQPLWGSRYSLLCSQVMFGVVKWAEQSGYTGDVSYFYEDGVTGWAQAQEAMKRIHDESVIPREGLRFSSVGFISKRKAAALQCADLLAWHWRKQMGREAEGVKRLRGDFKSLLELKCDLHHYDKTAIDRWIKDLNLAPPSLGVKQA